MNDFIILTAVLLGIGAVASFIMVMQTHGRYSESRVNGYWGFIGAGLYALSLGLLHYIGDGITPAVEYGGEGGRILTAVVLLFAIVTAIVECVHVRDYQRTYRQSRRRTNNGRVHLVVVLLSAVAVFTLTGWAWSVLFL